MEHGSADTQVMKEDNMNGYDTYENRVREKIDVRIKNSNYGSYLRSFSNHMNALAENTVLNYVKYAVILSAKLFERSL